MSEFLKKLVDNTNKARREETAILSIKGYLTAASLEGKSILDLDMDKFPGTVFAVVQFFEGEGLKVSVKGSIATFSWTHKL